MSKPKRRGASCNPFKRRDEKDADGKCDVPLVDFEPKLENSKPRTSFVYDDRALESSEVVTPASPHALKLFEAIREDEMELVEEELATLTDKREIDKLGGHGFALIHVAARYNFSRIVSTLLDHGAHINIGTCEHRWTPLHLAARFNGLSTVVDVLLPRGADPSLRGRNGYTPLHLAARRGNEEIVKVLLDQPSVAVDAKDDSGKTALHFACSEGHRKVCQILLNFGADIKAVSTDKTTPLHSAIFNGHSEVARMILKRAADRDVDANEKELVGNEDLQSNTVLHMAAWNNDIKTAELCLDNGADVDSLKCNSVTALHLAASKGNLEMADFLISRGAGVNMKDEDSKTPLHRAALFNQFKLIEFLVGKGAKLNARDVDGRSPFLNAVAAGHVDSARVLLDLGADFSATDLHMKTCVHIAVEHEHLDILSMLLGGRPGINCLNKGDLRDRVPLHYAANTTDIKILELLLSKQKRLSFQDENHKTPLHLAAEQASSKHVEALAKCMSEVNARDDLGRTPLHSAARKGQRKSCFVLLNMGAEVDSKDNKFRTPLMWAAKGNHLKCAEILLNFKASADLQDIGGDSALHVACGQGHPAIVSLLLEHGASSTLSNKQGFSCLEIAAKAGSSDAAMALVKHKRWKELENYETSSGQTAISLLIENFPEAAEVVLNQCVHPSEHLNTSDPDYTITYDFKNLDRGPDVKTSSKRFSAVQTMMKHKRQRLLLHPLTLKFNERKWYTLGRYAFLVDFVTYLILMILFTIFIVDQRRGQNFRPAEDDRGTTPRKVNRSAQGSLKPKPSDIYRRDSAFTETVPALVMIFSVLHMCKELFQIYVQRWSYFKDFSNYLDWTLYITTALFMVPYVTSPDTLDIWFEGMKDPRVLWIVGVVAIFVCYTNMMLFLRRYRLFGTYISMYVEVTKTVFQVLAVFVFLVLGFALVFHVLFREQVGFHTVHHSLLRVMTMMIGELDFGATFIDTIKQRNDVNNNPLNPFPPVGFLFIFLCLILLTVALMNLLVGLAVGDTETMKKYATIKRLGMQLEYQFQLEEAYPKFIIQKVYEMVYVEKPNQLHWFSRMAEWLQATFSEVAPDPVEDDQPSELAEVKAEMMKNKKRIKSMMATLDAQNKLLMNLAATINRKFELPEEAEVKREEDVVDGAKRTGLKADKKSEEEPMDGEIVEFPRK